MKGFNLLSSKYYLWLALIASMILALWIQLPRIMDPFALEEDLRTLYWVHRYQEPELYSAYPLEELGVIDYQIGNWIFVNETSAPGYSLMYQLASYFVSPVLFSKLLAFPLMLAAVYYLFRIIEKWNDRGTALALSLAFIVLILASHSEISVMSGLHRSFAIPLNLALVYYLMEKRFRVALLVLFFIGVIYLPIFPVALMTYIFCLISLREEGHWQLQVQWRRLIELIIVVLIVLIAVSPTIFLQIKDAQEGVPSTNGEEQHLLENPQFQEGGRRPLFVLFPFIGRGGLTTAAQDGLHLMLMALFAMIILILRRRQVTKPPPELSKLLYASLLGYVLAWAAILLTSSLLLYLPSRHSRAGLFLFLLVFVGLNAKESLRVAVGWVLRNRQKLIWYMLPLAVVVIGFALYIPRNRANYRVDFRSPLIAGLLIGLTMLLLILIILTNRRKAGIVQDDKPVALPGKTSQLILGGFLLVFSLFYLLLMVPTFYSPSEDNLPFFEFVQTLPEDSLLAGSPCQLDNIPFYGKRPVLFSCERFLLKPEMILDNFRALYATEVDRVTDFCRKYGVTHLVVDVKMFEEDYLIKGDYFFEPFNSILAPELTSQSDFLLNKVLEGQKLFQHNSIFVIPCDLVPTSIGAG